MLDKTLAKIRGFVPSNIFKAFQPAYHTTLAFFGAFIYRFPSTEIKIIAVTGTKGKSSTTEILNAILEEDGHKTALTNTIRFKIGDQSQKNLYKMSMPGRFFMQKFIRQSVDAKCEYAIIEMTSQGSILNRHKFIELNTFLFTNISPEHIESHGSYDNYLKAKLDIASSISKSHKFPRTLIINSDDKEYDKFLEINADKKITFSVRDLEPYNITDDGLEFTLDGRRVKSKLRGLFNLYNIAAAITVAKNENIAIESIINAITKIDEIPGRVQKINIGQKFEVVVDYAHTADSLEKLYATFSNVRKICVLGGTGGGRDNWKRKEMGRLADKYCSEIILTNEDPYDEDPRKIVDDVALGITNKKPLIIMDRREAIAKAISVAKDGDAILITGKGTDPYIMGPRETKIPWSDAKIAEEELEKSVK